MSNNCPVAVNADFKIDSIDENGEVSYARKQKSVGLNVYKRVGG